MHTQHSHHHSTYRNKFIVCRVARERQRDDYFNAVLLYGATTSMCTHEGAICSWFKFGSMGFCLNMFTTTLHTLANDLLTLMICLYLHFWSVRGCRRNLHWTNVIRTLVYFVGLYAFSLTVCCNPKKKYQSPFILCTCLIHKCFFHGGGSGWLNFHLVWGY